MACSFCSKDCYNKTHYGYCKTTGCINPKYNGVNVKVSQTTVMVDIYPYEIKADGSLYKIKRICKMPAAYNGLFVWWKDFGAKTLTREADNNNNPVILFFNEDYEIIGTLSRMPVIEYLTFGLNYTIDEVISNCSVQ